MKLFTIGPVQMYERTLEIRSQRIPYFRTAKFSRMVHETDLILKEMIGTDQKSKTIYLTASGTAAMEAAVTNCFSSCDKLLIVNGGTFGERFVQIARHHKIPYEVIKLPFGEVLSEQHLCNYLGKGISGVLVNLDETSTGQLYDVSIIRSFCKKENALLVVDAISTFLCDEYHMDDYGIDMSIISSQKGLCISPGLSMIILGKKALQKYSENQQYTSYYFSYEQYLRDVERGQTPFTPAIGTLMELYDILTYVKQKGLGTHLEEIAAKANHFRSRMKGLHTHLYIPSYPLSNAITPVILKKANATQLIATLSEEYEMMVNPTGGEMGNQMIRVAHIGALMAKDYDDLADAMCNVLSKEQV